MSFACGQIAAPITGCPPLAFVIPVVVVKVKVPPRMLAEVPVAALHSVADGVVAALHAEPAPAFNLTSVA